MGNSLSLSVQSDLVSASSLNITTYTSVSLPSTTSSSTLPSVLFNNERQFAKPVVDVVEVQTFLSNNGRGFTTIEVINRVTAESNPSEDFGSKPKAVAPSIRDGNSQDESTTGFRIQPRGEEIKQDAVLDSYAASAKDRIAIEKQYVSPTIQETPDSSGDTTPSVPASGDIALPKDHTATNTSPETQARRKPPQFTKTPTLIRIPHIPIQLFGRRHIHSVVALMERELEQDSEALSTNPRGKVIKDLSP